MKDIDGKTAFVTGAARGIGFAIAKSFGARGAKVMISDVDEQKLAASRDELIALGIDADFVVCDVSDPDSVDLAAQRTLERFGKIHFLVNNAGVSCGGPTGAVPIADWKWTVGINLMGVVHGVEIFTPLIAAHGEGGHIINVASIAGHLPFASGGPWSGIPKQCAKIWPVPTSVSAYFALHGSRPISIRRRNCARLWWTSPNLKPLKT